MSAATPFPPGNGKRGFSLVELITVIGVITVLVSILIPATTKVRKSAMRVVCAANLRQLTNAALLYAKDNEGQLPYPNWACSSFDDTVQQAYGYGWLYEAAHYRRLNWLPLPHPPEDGVKCGVIWPYLQNMELYHCPMDDPAFRVRINWLTSYVMNGSQCGFGELGVLNVNSPGLRLPSMKAPSESVMLWEALEQRYEGELNTAWVWNDGSSKPAEEVMADRHSKGANLSCYDGHVEWWDNDTWKYWASKPGFGRLWCFPLSSDGRQRY